MAYQHDLYMIPRRDVPLGGISAALISKDDQGEKRRILEGHQKFSQFKVDFVFSGSAQVSCHARKTYV
jgi:hypothetical protein